MVKIGLFIAFGVVGAALARPVTDENLAQEIEQQLQQYRQGALVSVLGGIGTALVPIFGAVLGPILTNLATGISTAFNNGLNPAARPTKADSFEVDGQTLLIRIPTESLPNYIAEPSQQAEGLPSVGPYKPFGPGKSGLPFVDQVTEDSSSSQEDIYDSVGVDASGERGQPHGASPLDIPPIKRHPQKHRPVALQT